MSSEAFQAALQRERLGIDGDIEVFFERAIDDPEGFLQVEKYLDDEELLTLDADDRYLNDQFEDFLEGLQEYVMRGGKRFRPSALVWSYRAFGGDLPRRALQPVHLAVELYHNSTLIHDDIMDQDGTRRGEETWHVRRSRELEERATGQVESGAGWSIDSLPRIEMVAVGEAIDAGNVLEDLSRKAITESALPRDDLYDVVEIMTDTDIRVNSGQNADLRMELLSVQEIARRELGIDVEEPALRDRLAGLLPGAVGDAVEDHLGGYLPAARTGDGTPSVEGLYEEFAGRFDSWSDAYLNMIDRKTGDLYEACVRVGAELADATREQEEDLVRAMRHMSRAFQIQDDYLELEESVAETGKEPTDVINGKLTLASISAYENMNDALALLDVGERAAREQGVYDEVFEGEIEDVFDRGGTRVAEALRAADIDGYMEDVDTALVDRIPDVLSRGRDRIRTERERFLRLYGNVDQGDPEMDEVRDLVLDYSTAKERAREEIGAAKRTLDGADLDAEYGGLFRGFADYMLERSH